MAEINQKENSSLSISDIAKIAKEYFIEILKYSWLVVILAVLAGNFMYNRKMATPTTYTADFSFAFNEAVSANKNNIASLFGGGASFLTNDGENSLSLSKLQEIIKTRKILMEVLFHKVRLKQEQNSEEDFVINHYLRKFHYKREKNKDDFYFKSDSINPYDTKANYWMKYVQALIIKNHLILDPATHIMHLKVISESEDFSYELLLALYEELSKYYDEQSTGQKKRFYEMAVERTAQLKKQLNNAEANYISYVNTNSAEAGGRHNIMIKTQFLSTDLKNATEAYFGALQTTEAAWVSYESQRQIPTLIMVDPPLYPLVVVAPNPFLHMVLGVVFGGGFAIIFVVLRKFIRDFLKKEKDINNNNNDTTIAEKELEKMA